MTRSAVVRLAVAFTLAIAATGPTLAARSPAPIQAAQPTVAPASATAAQAAPAATAQLRPALPAGVTERDVLTPDAVRLHVIEGGPVNAPRLLLIHGLGDKAALDWLGLLPPLMRDYRVQAVDLPGFGLSRPNVPVTSLGDYARLLDWLLRQGGNEPVAVVGHSLGGAVALRLAHDYPGSVERLLIIDAAGILHHTVFAEYMARVRPPGNKGTVIDDVVATSSRWLNRLSRKVQDKVASGASNPVVLATSNRALALYGRNSNAQAAVALAGEDFSDKLPHIRTPVWILWGEQDPVAPLRTARALGALLPRSRLQVLPAIGHVPMQEAPAATLQWMQQSLAAPDLEVAAPAARTARGSAECRNRGEPVEFSDGAWDTVTIERCTQVTLRNAHIRQLIVRHSEVVLENVQIDGTDTAVDLVEARLEATGLHIRAPRVFALRSSRVDLAAAHIEAPDWGPPRPGSRLFFSVSQWCDGQARRSLHLALDTDKQGIGAQLQPLDTEPCSAPLPVSASAATGADK